jgi:CHAT domain-containing protein/Tfp pilus assembly protein PilF
MELRWRNSACFLAFLTCIGLLLAAHSHQVVGCMLQPAQAVTKNRQQQQPVAGQKQDLRALEPGQPITRELAEGQQHTYQIKLSGGQYLKVIIAQQGIDVKVQLLGVDGEQILEFDSESMLQGKEEISLVAEREGDYRLNVQPKWNRVAAGSYEIRVEELRVATDDDRALHEASKLFDEARKLVDKEKYDEALPLIQRAMEIREKLLGPNHRDVAAVNSGIAILYHGKGEYAKAVPYYERALSITEKVRGSEHPDVADSLDRLAICYLDRGEYAKASLIQARAVAIFEKTLGAEHPKFASSLNTLAGIHKERGEYAEAESLFKRALVLSERSLGSDHPDVARPLGNLAILYNIKSEFAKAEPLILRVISIHEKALGPEHGLVADSLKVLADSYTLRGNYIKAEQLYQRVLAIYEKSYGPEHYTVAYPLNSLAILYWEQGESAKAVLFQQRALGISEKVLGSEHPHVAIALTNLARIHWSNGEYAKAESLLGRALTIFERVLGAEHPSCAYALNDLANLYRSKGEYVRAEQIYERALSIYERARGPEHPDTANSLDDMAMLYAAKGDMPKAVAFQSRANSVTERNLELNLAAGSESQKLAYLARAARQTAFTLWLHSRAAPKDPQALDLAFTTLLRRKARGLDAMTDTIASLRRRAATQDQELFDRLADARSRLAALVFKESRETKPEDYRAQFRPLAEEVEKLEADLSARSPEIRGQTQPVTLSAVQAALPDASVLIEFVIYTPQTPQYGKTQLPRYLAYLLAPRGEPRWVDLGEAAPIDQVVNNWRRSLRENLVDVKRLGRKVDELVMRPVRSSLQDLLGDTRGTPQHLLIAPDGSLNLMPFAALVDEENHYLIERYTISYLTSGRDLLSLQASTPSRNAPLIVANPNFGGAEGIAARRTRKPGTSRIVSQAKKQSDRDRPLFRHLPGTREEALAIKSVLPDASMLMGDDATESALREARAPHILHIATHGFFLSEQEEPGAGAMIEGGVGDELLRLSGMRLSKWAGHIKEPLLRSGLALAGANGGNRVERGKEAGDDGVLTALEMAGLDLWGTRLVVLSACDTGIGEVMNGEGVKGLRRALVLAGSESQVMTLWAVGDERGKDTMRPYYEALRRGEGRSEGLRQVQLRMLRSKGRHHPYYWAAFIQSGEWGNLEGLRERPKRK